MKDITGQRFHKLVALEPTKKRRYSNGSIIWKFQCDCGNIAEKSVSDVISGRTKSCGCLASTERRKDITGQRFNKLIAIEPTKKRYGSSVVWKFQCDCGNIVEKRADNVVTGHTKSCGCLAPKERRINITGQRFNKLVALEPTEKRYNRAVIWKFQCDCGNIVEKSARSVVSGNTKSCGCMSKGREIKNITGQRFGKLVALEPTEKREDGSVVWKFQCDCGNIVELAQENVGADRTRSCGCIGKERRIKDITGLRFGKLVALEPTEKRYKKSVIWKFQCDCGNIVEKSAHSVVTGNTKSCGCMRGKSYN